MATGERMIFSLPHRLSFLVLSCFIWTQVEAQWSGATVDTLTRDSYRDEVGPQSFAIDVTNTLHAVWQRAKTGGGWRVFYSRRTAPSLWTTPSEVGDSTLMAFTPAFAIDKPGSKRYVVYRASYPPSDEIVVAQDSAGTWLRSRITTNGTQDLSPTIAVDANGKVHLAWIGQDTSNAWKIYYATNLSGTWNAHLLMGSDLGPFGSGASPFIAVTSAGVAHIFYRGGDYTLYHIHHAQNSSPGGASWTYEIVTTPNANDFTAQSVVTTDGTLHLLASGNDGFGFPPHAYYLKKPLSGSWSAPELANTTMSGNGFSLHLDQYGKAHVAVNEVSGNIITGNLYYASNRTGNWTTAPLQTDGKTYNGVLVLDNLGKGHVLTFNGSTFQTQEILAIHSQGVLTSLPEKGSEQPYSFKLYQNYPNPFNPSTIINYQLPFDNYVTLKVFNMLGQEIATLSSEEKSAGSYNVEWNARQKDDGQAEGVASGVYFYRLTAGDFVETKKMLMIR